MTRHRFTTRLGAAAALALGAFAATAQEAPENLKIYFEIGSATVAADQRDALDQAARLFREGDPIVMIVAGGADTLGPPDLNLDLSVARAESVAQGLVARGIPADRLQVVGRGTTELPVETEDGVAEQENRYVEISWR